MGRGGEKLQHTGMRDISVKSIPDTRKGSSKGPVAEAQEERGLRGLKERR